MKIEKFKYDTDRGACSDRISHGLTLSINTIRYPKTKQQKLRTQRELA
jgi:hypothetical protein